MYLPATRSPILTLALAVIVLGVVLGLPRGALALDIAEHRITFAFGPNPEDTLKIPYARNVRLMDSHPGYDRAVVMIHGTGRTALSYYNALLTAAEDADHAEDHSILLAPQFLLEEDLDGYTTNDSLLFWDPYLSNVGCWKSGGPSLSTPDHPRPHTISSFAVVDSILYRLATRNPDLRTIVVAGHSAGGQFTNRYAAGNQMEQLLTAAYPDLAIRYVVANPSSYLYFTDERRIADTLDEFAPHSGAGCSDFNEYIYGLEDLNPYLAAVGADNIIDQYSGRDVRYLLGELDTETHAEDPSVDGDCAAELQGHHRRERGRVYYNYMVHLGFNYYGDQKFAIVADAPHDKDDMFVSDCGIYHLFDYGACGTASPVFVSPDPLAARIQEVIYVVPEGTTILLEDGVFKGVGNRAIDFVGKVISVQSASGDPQSCVIDCENVTRGFRFHSGETPESRLKDITIRNGWIAESGGGVSCYFESSPSIRNCIFDDNDAGEHGGGLYCAWSSDPEVINCTFVRNGATLQGGGIACGIYSHMTLRNTLIAYSTSQRAFWCAGGDKPAYLRCCNFYGNTGGDWEGVIADSLGEDGNISEQPLFCSYPSDLSLCADSPCLVATGACAPLIGAVGQGCDACDDYVCCVYGECYIFSDPADCTALGGTWHTDWQSCEPNPCPPPSGACCQAGAVCQILTEADCLAAGGAYQGHDTNCTPNPCPAVCCTGETCTVTTEAACSGTWYPDLASCDDPNPCRLRACCVGETCTRTTEQDCSGDWYPAETSCSPNPCITPTGVCCTAASGCSVTSEDFCVNVLSGTWYPEWDSCDPNPCVIAPCCVDESCSFTIESDCAGDWYPGLTDCVPNPCVLAVCCTGDDCVVVIESECADLGGQWFSEWDSCSPNPCRQRACCQEEAACTVLREDECLDLDGTWLADEASCDPNPCLAGCCVDGVCTLLTESECLALNGVWYPWMQDCGPPDPCPGVCCHDAGTCSFVAHFQCDNLGGTWHAEGISCDPNPCRHIVKPDGSGDYATIQAAINAVSNDEVIALTNGEFLVSTHQGNETEGINYYGKRIEIFSLSGNAATCFIDGDASERCLMFNSGEGSSSVLRGVTIRNGSADLGAGIACRGASPSIRECVFAANQAIDSGGGLLCTNSSSPQVSDCSFTGNSAGTSGGGIASGGGSSVWLEGSLFFGNAAGWFGGGLYCATVGSPAAEGNGCTFYGNTATSGGAIHVVPGSLFWLDRTLIAFNAGGGAVYSMGGPVFTCTDIYGNVGGDWTLGIAGQEWTNGNISEDPLFCGAPENLTLSWNSPCAPGFSPPGCDQIGALGVGCGSGTPGTEPGLEGGVLIAHHPPGLQYTATDLCELYETEHAITSCDEQNNRIDDSDYAMVWYVLAAWHGEREWWRTEFGLGAYGAMSYGLFDHGPCFPDDGTVTVTSGWPGPNEGVTVDLFGTHWSGNFVPVYWFAGYTYTNDVIPLSTHPLTGFAGVWGGDYPLQIGQATCLGAMGLGMEGVYCCPEPSMEPAVCCVAGHCYLISEAECGDLAGTWYGEWSSCDPNPCVAVCCAGAVCTLVTEAECEDADGVWDADGISCDPNPCPAVCCIEEACVLTTQAGCANLDGLWYPAWDVCAPNPCLEPIDWADHDVGECILTMTDQGIIGFMDGNQTEGSGFLYPQGGINLLWVGSLWVGESESYVANRDYDADPAREWMVSADPDGHVWIDENGTSHQDIHSCYTDAGAATPRNLFVDQESWAYALNSVARDFVIVRYTLRNDGASTLNDLYAGCFMDFDLSYPYTNDWGGVDADRDLAYMTDSSNVHVGVRVLQAPGDPPVANVTLIPNADYVWPNQYVLDADKHGFLTAGPGYVVTNVDSLSDYSALVSAGPLTLMPDEERLIAFAIVGGRDLAELQLHAHVAQLIYTNGFTDVPEEQAGEPIRITCLRANAPNPFTGETVVRFDVSQPSEVRIVIFDPIGRLVRTLARGRHESGRHALTWDCRGDDGRPVPGGVYFLRLRGEQTDECRRIILLR